MTTIATRRILVAVNNPSGPAATAVLKAVQLARALKAELSLFHVIELPLAADSYAGDEQRLTEDEQNIRTQYLRALEEQAEPMCLGGLVVSVSAQWDHPVSEAIARGARDIGADLLVIGQSPQTRSHTTVQQLLRISQLPVLLIRTPRRYQAPAVLAAVSPSHRRARAHDLDAAICQHAQGIGAALAGSWCVVNATPHRRIARRFYEDPRLALRRVLPDAGLLPRSLRCSVERPIPAILAAATATNAQIIVLGAARAFDRVQLGTTSVLRHLLERSPCDLLIVKPRTFGWHFATQIRGPQMLSATGPSGSMV